MAKIYIVDVRHNASSDPDLELVNTLDEAADVIEEFYKEYDFELKGGSLRDANDETDTVDEIEWHNGRIIGFQHAGGDGPCACVREGKTTVIKAPCKKGKKK
jgi:hypothetical protein